MTSSLCNEQNFSIFKDNFPVNLIREYEGVCDVENNKEKSLQATLLVVEDDPATLIAYQNILEGAGFQVLTAINGKEALESFYKNPPDLILSGIKMPIMDGFELFKAVRQHQGGAAIPFIFLTALGTREDRFAGIKLGADDYLTKPITAKELISAVQARLKRTDEIMVGQLKVAIKGSVNALTNAIKSRDKSTHHHVVRVNAYAKAMAYELEWDDERIEALEYGAILHDIGKIAVRLSILLKNGPLTPEEWDIMKRHPEDGAQMIGPVLHSSPAIPMIRHHHENWDGSGYPDGLRGKDIPEEARLLAVVNAFDVMTTDQPYRPALAANDAIKEIVNNSGSQFDPKMVEAFRRCWDRGDIQVILKGSQ
jgi:putative two-component system response regulator